MKGGGATDEEWYAGLLVLVLLLLSLEVFAVHLLMVLEGVAKYVAVCYQLQCAANLLPPRPHTGAWWSRRAAIARSDQCHGMRCSMLCSMLLT